MLTRGRRWGSAAGAFLGGSTLAIALNMGECLFDIPALCPIPQHLRAAALAAGIVAGGILGFLYTCIVEQLLAPWSPPSRRTTTGLILGLSGGIGWPAAGVMTAGALLMDAHSAPSRGYAQLAVGSAIAGAVLLIAFFVGAALLLADDDARRGR